MTFPYLTMPSSQLIRPTYQEPDLTFLPQLSTPPLSNSNESSYPESFNSSRATSPTPEVYHLLYENLCNKWKHQGEELEKEVIEEGVREEEQKGVKLIVTSKKNGIAMKRKRSSSLDRFSECSNEKAFKSVKLEVEEEELVNIVKIENESETKNIHRRRSSLPSLPKSNCPTVVTVIEPHHLHKQLLFSLNNFLTQVSASIPTSPNLDHSQSPIGTISIPLSRTQSHGFDPTAHVSSTARKVELTSVVRSFEKVLKERAEGWKRLEECEKHVFRGADDWHF